MRLRELHAGQMIDVSLLCAWVAWVAHHNIALGGQAVLASTQLLLGPEAFDQCRAIKRQTLGRQWLGHVVVPLGLAAPWWNWFGSRGAHTE